MRVEYCSGWDEPMYMRYKAKVLRGMGKLVVVPQIYEIEQREG